MHFLSSFSCEQCKLGNSCIIEILSGTRVVLVPEVLKETDV